MFRGVQLSRQELETNYIIGDQVNIAGFISTTLEIKSGLNFAFQNIKKEHDEAQLPILLEIDIKGSNQFFFLNNEEYSAFSLEQEVLI